MELTQDADLIRYIHLKLASIGHPTPASEFLEIAAPLLRNYYRKTQLLHDRLCPVDTRIQAFLTSYLEGLEIPRLPSSTLVLDRPGLARVLSLPPDSDTQASPYLRSYRIKQGVLHNPRSDRRTTKGIFHITEGGLPVPADKIGVPKQTFAALLNRAFTPPQDVLELPFTATQEQPVHLFTSLLLRPLVCPATGSQAARSMETRFFVPASLVSNLDFIERIFGNAGDPDLPENDSALDLAHWSGHTGCVILAPHLTTLLKKDVGLPHYDDATPRQRRDGMCWKDPGEIYNSGVAFKITARDERGVMVTILADNYYGYCKKEVKTQISYAANLFGMCEEEHAGGALAFPAYVLGQQFHAGRTVLTKKVTFEQAMHWLGDRVEIKPERYAVDRRFDNIFYVPENADFSVLESNIVWPWPEGGAGRTHKLTLRANDIYVLPWGTKIRLEKQLHGTAWRLVASRADGILCHKPSTVSGGGKSEISKSIGSIILKGPVFVTDFHRDIEHVAGIVAKDFSGIYCKELAHARAARPILSTERSLGSVIKLMTPSPEYTDDYNRWLATIPQTVRQLLITVKRYYQPEWGDDWRRHFSVDRINGLPGNELKFQNQTMVGNYLRMGYDPDGSWRIFKLRPDFNPADKVQFEDDITASVVLPAASLNNLDPEYKNESVKLVENCETLLFQRPDDAIYRGFDKDAEADIASSGIFISNFEPLTVAGVQDIVDEVVEFDKYTEPMKRLLLDFLGSGGNSPSFVVSSAHPRIVDGAPSKNPRYLQKRPDLTNPRGTYVAEIGTRLAREIPPDARVHFPVSAVLSGRRNNPADHKAGIPPLAVYNPIHYQELPELFMDMICSLTGKSPATTGFGTEGALTKGPFNALLPVVDINNALVSAILTGNSGFTTAAGYIGPRYRVDHDSSILVPELWCRMRVFEREPRFLIENGYLERIDDFAFENRTVLASRLGYRITAAFVDRFLGRIFELPGSVFPEEMLRPERQNLKDFAEGIDAIVAAQRNVALEYFEDGGIDFACPPIKALLHIMVYGHYQQMQIEDSCLRAMFTRNSLLASDWYRERLLTQQKLDIALATRLNAPPDRLRYLKSEAYLASLTGTIGADPCLSKTAQSTPA
jgi:phosphoenolpyruvate carboxykinase (diphosphate)